MSGPFYRNRIAALAGKTLLSLLLYSPLSAQTHRFSFTLAAPALTSGGVFDSQGNLIKELWSMQSLPAGTHERIWDGFDSVGRPAAPDQYTFKVILNGSTYTPLSAVGNSGDPANPKSTNESTGVYDLAPYQLSGEAGDIRARTWSEGLGNVRKVDIAGNAPSVGAVGGIAGMPYSVTTDGQYAYFGVNTGVNTNTIVRLSLDRLVRTAFPPETSASGDIAVSVRLPVPADAPERDKPFLAGTLVSLAVDDTTLYACDPTNNLVRLFNKTTGQAVSSFAATFPMALALDSGGRLWVAHDHTKVSLYTKQGVFLKEVLNDGDFVVSLAFDPQGHLAVADRGTSTVRFYSVDNDVAVLDPTLTFGGPLVAGDTNTQHLRGLKKAVFDAEGNMIVLETRPGGRHISKWTPGPNPTRIFHHYSSEFLHNGAFNPNDITEYWSSSLNRYDLTDKTTGAFAYGVDGMEGNIPGKAPNGSPKIRRLNGEDFFFDLAGGDFRVYRIVDHSHLHLASWVGWMLPTASGNVGTALATWHDINGSGVPQVSEIHRYNGSAGTFFSLGANVDQEGNLWFGNTTNRTVEQLLVSFDDQNNPVYDWNEKKIRIQPDPSFLKFVPYIVQRANNGDVYCVGNTSLWPNSSGIDQDGSTMAKFDSSGKRLWIVKLPEDATTLEIIPPRVDESSTTDHGVLAGGFTGKVFHYSPSGLLIGKAMVGPRQGNVTGWFDIQGALSVERDRTDNKIWVSAEEVFLIRDLIYTIDEQNISEINVTTYSVDPLPTLNLVLSDRVASETVGNNAAWTLYRAGDLSNELTVSLAWAGQAVNGIDYQSIPNSLTFPAGKDVIDVPIVSIDDQIIEGDEPISLKILPSPDYVLGMFSISTATIQDNDRATVTVETVDGDASVGGGAGFNYALPQGSGGNNGFIKVTRTGETSNDFWFTAELTGTAVNGLDYRGIGLPHIMIPAGRSSIYIPILPYNRQRAQDVSLTFRLTPKYIDNYDKSKGTWYDIGVPASADVTIHPSPSNHLPVVMINALDPHMSKNDGNKGMIRLARGGNLAQALDVTFLISGTAKPNIDYAPLPSVVTIPAGKSYIDFFVQPTRTMTGQGNKKLVVMSAPAGTYNVGPTGAYFRDNAEATLTIEENPPIDAPWVSIEATAKEAFELGRKEGTFTLTRTGDTSQTLNIGYISIEGTAVFNSDYVVTPWPITITAGSSFTIVHVTPTDDANVEGNESFTLTLYPYDQPYKIGGPNQATIMLYDNEKPGLVVEATQPETAEYNGTPGKITFVRKGANNQGALTLPLLFTGAAINGIDYQALASSVTIPNGSDRVSLDVLPLSDGLYEGTEDIVIGLDAARILNYSVAETTPSATISLSDDPPLRITTPKEDASVTGLVTVNTNAPLIIDAHNVELYVDGSFVDAVAETPFSFQWNTAGLSVGSHVLKVIAALDRGITRTHQISVFVTHLGHETDDPRLLYPNIFTLGQDVPFAFYVKKAGEATVEIYTRAGQLVRSMEAGPQQEGIGSFKWDGRNTEGILCASGIYIVRVRVDDTLSDTFRLVGVK